MGRNSRQRRKEKLRKRRANGARPASRPADGSGRDRSTPPRAESGTRRPGPPPDVDVLLTGADFALGAGDADVFGQIVAALVELSDSRAAATTVPATIGARLEAAVRGAWPAGWQPADLVRTVKRKLGARTARLVTHVIAADARGWRNASAADPAWLEQLADLGAQVWWDPYRPLLPQWARVEGLTRTEALSGAVQLLSALWHIPSLPLLGPPPHHWGRDGARQAKRRRTVPTSLDPKVLGRVRALLVKAESTSFPEEAEALTAKAQQLMTRHAIDHTMLEGDDEEEPAGRRLPVDDPYASAKSLLLSEVAEASRCRAVASPDLGFSTVFGFPVDLEVVEILYTSLLVQGTAAMVAAGSLPGRGRRYRSRSFRQSFLVAYALRIGDRLREASAASVEEAQAEHGDALLPVLASRSRHVEEARDKAFPHLSSRRYSISDGAGWAAGVLAADQASLALGPELASTAGDADAACA